MEYFIVIFNCLHHIDVEFNNGCRAPPWRQVNGDITYLLIDTFDAGHLTVTCNRSGVYINNVN